MKKIISIFLIMFLLCGCSLKKETPSDSVEEYLLNYKSLNNNVLSELKTMVKNTDFNAEHKEKYMEIMKKQYSNMDYKIESVTIDKNEASVGVKINVLDYFKTNRDASAYRDSNVTEFITNGRYDQDKFDLYLLNYLEETTSKTDYLLEFKLTKEGKKWVIKNIDKTMKEKMQGIYDYNG